MTKPTPEGWHSVTPRLVVHDAAILVEFLKQAFGATGDFRTDIPSVIGIGDSLVMVSSVAPATPCLHFSTSMLTTSTRTSVRWKPAPCHWKSQKTCRMAAAAGWSKIRAETFGKSQLTKRTWR